MVLLPGFAMRCQGRCSRSAFLMPVTHPLVHLKVVWVIAFVTLHTLWLSRMPCAKSLTCRFLGRFLPSVGRRPVSLVVFGLVQGCHRISRFGSDSVMSMCVCGRLRSKVLQPLQLWVSSTAGQLREARTILLSLPAVVLVGMLVVLQWG